MCRASGNWKVWILYETGGIVNTDIIRAYTVSKPVSAFVKKFNHALYHQGSRHALPVQLTRIRHPYGTWKIPLSAALFPT